MRNFASYLFVLVIEQELIQLTDHFSPPALVDKNGPPSNSRGSKMRTKRGMPNPFHEANTEQCKVCRSQRLANS